MNHKASAVLALAPYRFELTRLHRISVGPIALGDVEEGCCRELARKEVEALYKRCLPEDPLCPTVAAVEGILARRLAHAARQTAGLEGCHSTASATDNSDTTTPVVPQEVSSMDDETGDKPPAAGKAEERRAVGGGGDEADGLQVAHRKEIASGRGAAAKAFASAEDLTDIVRLLINFARRDLHETPPGPEGESAGPDFCPGEKESLAQARAIPPNERHMECGYRSSQIERLGLTYGLT